MKTAAASKPLSRRPMRYLPVVWLVVLSALAFLDRTNVSMSARDRGIRQALRSWGGELWS